MITCLDVKFMATNILYLLTILRDICNTIIFDWAVLLFLQVNVSRSTKGQLLCLGLTAASRSSLPTTEGMGAWLHRPRSLWGSVSSTCLLWNRTGSQNCCYGWKEKKPAQRTRPTWVAYWRRYAVKVCGCLDAFMLKLTRANIYKYGQLRITSDVDAATCAVWLSTFNHICTLPTYKIIAV